MFKASNYLLVVLVSLTATLSFADRADAQTPRILERILQGEETSDYPSVGIVGSQRNGEFCSGTLITPTYVLTAAHCATVIESDSSGTFRLGDDIYETDLVTIHPEYNRNTLANDIALLRLSEPVVDIEPAVIFRETPMVDDVLFIVGFGGSGTATEGSNGDFGTKRVGVTIIDEVTETMVNWYFDDPSEANTASGDSGGPGFLDVSGDLFVASITSGGTDPDSLLGDFAFNTRVDAYADWIDANLVDADDPDDEQDEGFWSKPFPFLQFLIDLLSTWLDQLNTLQEEGVGAMNCPTGDAESEAPVETEEPVESDDASDEVDQPSTEVDAPAASQSNSRRGRQGARRDSNRNSSRRRR